MDRRTSFLVAAGIFGGLAGCSHQSAMPVQSTQEPPRATAKKEKDEPKLAPKASTCIAMGQTSERSAEVAGRSQTDQQQLREQARRAYQQALKIEPTNLEALSALGNLYVTLNDFPRAAETFRKATEIAPRKPSVWFDLGMCHSRQKDWQPALTALQKAVDLDPENRQFVHTYGYCLARAGRFDESFAAFARIDGQAVAHYNVGRMLLHMREEEAARQHLRQAIELDKNMVQASELLSQMSQRVTMGAPSPIMQVSYEKPAPAEKATSPAEPTDKQDSAFSREAAAALQRLGGSR